MQPKPGGDATGRSQVSPRTVLVVLATVLAVIAGLYLLWQLQQILRWLAIAMFMAVTLAPPVDWLAQRRVPRALAILLVYLALVLAVAGLAALVVPPLADQVQGLVDAVVKLVKQPAGLDGELQKLARRFGFGGSLNQLKGQIDTLPTRLTSAAGPLITVTRTVISSVTALVSILLLAFFMLLDGERFLAHGLALVPPEQQGRVRGVLDRSAQAVYGYVSGNLTISLIAGVACFVVMKILGLPYAVALALVVALLDLIPLVGATLASAVVILVGLAQAPATALILLVYFVVYQQIENNILQPLVYGRSVKLHPLVVFVSVLVGAELLGILGALVAIPVAEVIRIVGGEWLAARYPHLLRAEAQAPTGEQP